MLPSLSALLVFAGISWSAQVRHAVVVGSNDGGGVLEPLRYAERDAEQMGEVLVELGGFDEELVTVLYSPSEAALREALAKHAAIAEKFDDDLFLFYYSGHADAQGLRLNTERYYFDTLKHDVRAMDADLRVGILDACRSGSISRLKGASVTPSLLDTTATPVEGEAWLMASSADESAQESESLRGGFFTHYLLSGMRGAADTNDGIVDIEELYRYTLDRVVANTSNTEAGTQHPQFDRNLEGGVLGITDMRNANALVKLPAGVGGHIAVLRLPDKVQVAELSKRSDDEVHLALPMGRYLIRRRDGEDLYEHIVGMSAESVVVVENWGAAKLQSGFVRGEPETVEEFLDQSEQYEYALNLASDPRIAGGASLLIPGAGQLYNRQIFKGLAYFAVTTSLVGTAFAGNTQFDPALGTMFGFALWGASVADAVYNVHRREEFRPRKGVTLSYGNSWGGGAWNYHLGASLDVMVGGGLSIGLDRVGFTPYEDGWDASGGTRVMMAFSEGEQWRPAGFVAVGYRTGRIPGATTQVSRLTLGAGLNARYYVVKRYFVEGEVRWEQTGETNGLVTGVQMGTHLGR